MLFRVFPPAWTISSPTELPKEAKVKMKTKFSSPTLFYYRWGQRVVSTGSIRLNFYKILADDFPRYCPFLYFTIKELGFHRYSWIFLADYSIRSQQLE